MVDLKIGLYYNFNTIAPEYLHGDYVDMKFIGSNTYENLTGSDVYQLWDIIRQSHQVLDFKLESFVTFVSKEGNKVTFGKSWIENIVPVTGLGRVQFTVDNCSIEDIQLIREQLRAIGKPDFIVKRVEE